MSKTKNLYKVHFLNEKKETTHLYASQVNPTSFLGLIEVSDIVFIDSSELIVTPEDDKIRKEFQDVEKTYIPISYILRIDEVTFKRETPIIRLYNSTLSDNPLISQKLRVEKINISLNIKVSKELTFIFL